MTPPGPGGSGSGSGSRGPAGPSGVGTKRFADQKPRRSREVRTASDAIKAALQFHGISDEIRAQRLLTEWSDLVGPRIAERTRPYGVTDRTLVIEVASSAWLQELNLLRTPILNGLFERLGLPRLFDDLKFRLATGRGRPDVARPRSRPAKPTPPPPIAATGLARERIAKEVEQVDDLELRELIARVRIGHNR